MSENFSLVLSPIKGEFFHSKVAQKYLICRPKAEAKIGVVKKTSIVLFWPGNRQKLAQELLCMQNLL